jgi:hypothetical protein
MIDYYNPSTIAVDIHAIKEIITLLYNSSKMSRQARSQKELSKVLASERRLHNEFAFHQTSHKQHILRKEYSNPHFVQSFSWKTDAGMLRYQ